MPRIFDSASVRLAGLGLALVFVIGCVSVAPPTASPGGSPSATAAPSLGPSTGPATPQPSGSGAPATETPTSSPDGSPGVETPGPTPDPALAAQIDAVTVQIPPIRQLDPTGEVPYEFITRDAFRDNLLETIFEDTPREWIEAEERMLKRLGLMPQDQSMIDLIVELYGASVAAYYRPDTGRFYIIERDAPFGATDKITVAHEYTHALQDQHYDLEGSRIKDLTAGDSVLAQLSAIEGDAQLTSQQWAIDHLTDAERVELLNDALEQLGDDPFANMPLILRRQLEFPYGEGFQFIDEIHRLGGYEAVNQLLENPPASTEQVLHSAKYFSGEAPVAITLDDQSATLGAGWTRSYEQTVGELGIQVFVGGGERPPVNIPGLPVEWPHQEVAAGWGGDRLDMYENGDAWAIVWETAWDSQADMDEFATRSAELLFQLDAFSSAAPADPARNGYVIWLASDQATLDALVAATQ